MTWAFSSAVSHNCHRMGPLRRPKGRRWYDTYRALLSQGGHITANASRFPDLEGPVKRSFFLIAGPNRRQLLACQNFVARQIRQVPKPHSRKRSATYVGTLCEKVRRLARTVRRSDGTGHMAESGTFTFYDPDSYAAGFGGPRIDLTITGAGDFRARLSRLKLKHLEIYWLRENLPRIAYLSLPPGQIFLSFPVGRRSPIFAGFACRNGDIVLHSRGEHIHQRSDGECQWGLVSLSPELLEESARALTKQPIALPLASSILRPPREEALRFNRLFKQACQLADARKSLIARPEVAKALEQEFLHAIIHYCLAADEADDNPKTRNHHAAVMVRFEEALEKHIDQRLSLPELCAEIGVPERTLRMCCAEFLGVSPTRYLLLQRLNKARSALRLADPSTASVTQIARNHQFLELGRFAVAYRSIFGETPSATLERDAPSPMHTAEGA